MKRIAVSLFAISAMALALLLGLVLSARAWPAQEQAAPVQAIAARQLQVRSMPGAPEQHLAPVSHAGADTTAQPAPGQASVSGALILNGDFEGDFYDYGAGQVAQYWVPFDLGTGPPPQFLRSTLYKQQGAASQQIWADNSPWHAGIQQTIALFAAASSGIARIQAGTRYTVHVWVYSIYGGAGSAVQNDKIHKRVGIHPSGETSPLSPEVIWTPWLGQDKVWLQINIAVVATGSQLTIFIEADDPESGGQDQLYIDGVWIEEEATPSPTTTPTRTPTPTGTPPPSLDVRGRVRLSDGTGVPGVDIHLYLGDQPQDEHVVATTDATGYYWTASMYIYGQRSVTIFPTRLGYSFEPETYSWFYYGGIQHVVRDFVAYPPGSPVILLRPHATSVPLGGTFTLDVVVEAVVDLGGFEFRLTFDPAIVNVQDVTLGSFLASTGRNAAPIGPSIDNALGQVTFGGFTFGVAAGPNGTGTVARITLQAVALGDTALTFAQAQLTNTQGVVPGPLASYPGSVSVFEPTPTPTPTLTPTLTPTPTPTPVLPGDMDRDCDVDIVDIMLVASRWGTSQGQPNYDPRYDVDGDGDIDIVDIMRVAAHWGTGCAPTPTTSPTPSPTPT